MLYINVCNVLVSFALQSFFGFGQSADIDISLDGTENRKMAEIKSEDGKKERHFLYYDGETVSGKVCSYCDFEGLPFFLFFNSVGNLHGASVLESHKLYKF